MMATRLTSYDIPSAYVRLDSRVTDEDQFANVRDLQTARLNHNKLVDRGIKRNLCNLLYHGGAGAADKLSYGHNTIHSNSIADRDRGMMLFSVPLIVSSYTKEVEVVIRAARVSASADCKVYCVADTSGNTGELNVSGAAGTLIDITSTATGTLGARYAMTVPLPPETQQNGGMCEVSGYLEGATYSSGITGGPFSVTAITGKYVEVDTAGIGGGTPNVDMVLSFASKPEIESNLITDIVNSGGTTYRFILEDPLPNILEVGDTVNFLNSTGLYCYSINIYENSPSTYDYDPEFY